MNSENENPSTGKASAAPNYDPRFIARLFDEMSGTYGLVNVFSSFGFCVLWRRQCLAHIPFRPGMVVYDLMSGMGELWPGVVRRMGGIGDVSGVDISPNMCKHAQANQNAARKRGVEIQIQMADVLSDDLPANAADVIVCSFGLKTFSRDQQAILASRVHRLLKPGGVFSFLEISVPATRILRGPYLFYLNHIIPRLGRLFLGNPENYRQLGIYTQAFGDCSHFVGLLKQTGLETQAHRHFFGCATSVSGKKNIQGC